MLADCQFTLVTVFVMDEAPLLPRSSVATTAQQHAVAAQTANCTMRASRA